MSLINKRKKHIRKEEKRRANEIKRRDKEHKERIKFAIKELKESYIKGEAKYESFLDIFEVAKKYLDKHKIKYETQLKPTMLGTKYVIVFLD